MLRTYGTTKCTYLIAMSYQYLVPTALFVGDKLQLRPNDISLVKKAVIDMRLSRIKFNKQSSNKKENKAFVKKEKVAPV